MNKTHRRLASAGIVAALAIGAGAWLAWQGALNSSIAAKPQADLRTAVEGGGYTNRLAHAESPYLRMHADNPVDWYAWGPKAFEKARKENKPIFLSVGYSTCHWCHVMERKSFMDPEIAKIMNENFINIKVDREERPDVDRIYMTFVRATTGSGGWPMSVWLTPSLKPFFGGTYFPPEGKYGRPGFKQILKEIAGRWEKDRQEIIASSQKVTQQLKNYAASATRKTVDLQPSLLEKAYQSLNQKYDSKHGGFGSAPKFPQIVHFNFLLRYYERTGQEKALDMTLNSLREIAKGGIRDHLGGGFHRYSVDRRWHVPHFEKMIYNQAQFTWAYLAAYQITDDPFYARVARDSLKYVLRDMTGPKGQFYSAEGADSPRPDNPSKHGEGAFYVWKHGDIVSTLGSEKAKVFNYYYGVKQGGNVRKDPHGEFGPRNVLHIVHSIEETAEKLQKTPKQVRTLLKDSRQELFERRAKRPRPNLDDKALTAWNGLMISAFARAHQVLGDDKYLEAAKKATAFVKRHLYEPKSGTLLRRYRSGEAGIDGYASDYAFFIQGLLDLYEASFKVQYLDWAVALQEKQDTLFWDTSDGGYFNTAGKSENLLFRMKETQDGAQPSPNSIAALNCLRLAQMTDNDAFRKRASETLNAFSKRLDQAPSSLSQLLAAYIYHLEKPKQILIAGNKDASDTEAMLNAVHKQFIPNKIVMLVNKSSRQDLTSHLSFVSSVTQKQGTATAYICQNYVCQQPTTDLKKMKALLNKDRSQATASQKEDE